MKSLILAARSKEGKGALMGIGIGILISCLGGLFLDSNALLGDFIAIAGAIFSMVGGEQFCRLIIQFREEIGEE